MAPIAVNKLLPPHCGCIAAQIEPTLSKAAYGIFISGFFLYLHHRQQTVPAEDIDLFRGPHALPTARANQLPGAAGGFAACGWYPGSKTYSLTVQHNFRPVL